MLELLNRASEKLRGIHDNLKHVLKDVNAIKKAFGKGDFVKIGTLIGSSEFEAALKTLNLQNIYDELKSTYGRCIPEARMEFDRKFHSACEELDLKEVRGDSMGEFRVRGILSIKINFQKNITEINTFARSKRIRSIDPIKVATETKNDIVRLFRRPFEPKLFLASLFQAYQKLISDSKQIVLLKDVHRLMWLDKQKDNFFATSDATKMVPYPLDEFSIDLSKLIESKVQSLDNGYVCRVSLGSGGVNIYGRDGNFNSYKFLEFTRGGGDG